MPDVPPSDPASSDASAAHDGHRAAQNRHGTDAHASTPVASPRDPRAGEAVDDPSRSAQGTTAPSWKTLFWPLLLSLLALGAIAAFTFEPGAFWTFARKVNPLLLGAACFMAALRVFVGGWRFRFISHGRLGWGEATRGQLAWDFLSNLTPTAVGGGPVAIIYLARDQNIPVGEASAFMLFSMVLDQLWFALSIPLLLGASAFIDVFPAAAGRIGHWTFFMTFAGLMIWAMLFAYATLVRPRLLQRLARWLFSFRLLQRFRPRVVQEATRFAERARSLRAESAGFYLKSMLLTLGVWIGRYLLAVLVIWSVYPALDLVLATLRSAALLFCGLLMPTPGGAGGLEGLYALFFGPLMPQTLMAPTLLVWRFLGYYVFLALGVYLSFHQARQELERHSE